MVRGESFRSRNRWTWYSRTWSSPPIRRPAKIPGELLDRMDIGPYGVRRVVATLELIQHHLAKMGHSEPPCDTHLSLNYRQNPPMLQHPPRHRLRSNAVYITYRRSIRAPTEIK